MPEVHRIKLELGGRPVQFDLNYHPTWQGRVIYEPEVVNIMGRCVKPGDCVIDAGANLGFFTLLASRLVGEDGLVIAFDADPRAYRDLCRNLKLNRINNVLPLELALYSKDHKEVPFWVTDREGYSSLLEIIGATSHVVEMRCLDTLLTDPNAQPQFMKIDCEGAEEYILKGARRILEAGVDCIVLELNFYLLGCMGSSPDVIRKLMYDMDYDMFVISLGDGNGGYLKPYLVGRDQEFKIQGDRHYMNVMFSTVAKVDELWGA